MITPKKQKRKKKNLEFKKSVDINERFDDSYMKARSYIAWRSERICETLNDVFQPASVVDVCCATGDLVAGWNKLNVPAYGIDGSDAAITNRICKKNQIVQADVSKPIWEYNLDNSDLCTCFATWEIFEPDKRWQLIKNLCMLSYKILISCTPEDLNKLKAIMKQFGYYQKEKPIEAVRERLEDIKRKQAIKTLYYNTHYFILDK